MCLLLIFSAFLWCRSGFNPHCFEKLTGCTMPQWLPVWLELFCADRLSCGPLPTKIDLARLSYGAEQRDAFGTLLKCALSENTFLLPVTVFWCFPPLKLIFLTAGRLQWNCFFVSQYEHMNCVTASTDKHLFTKKNSTCILNVFEFQHWRKISKERGELHPCVKSRSVNHLRCSLMGKPDCVKSSADTQWRAVQSMSLRTSIQQRMWDFQRLQECFTICIHEIWLQLAVLNVL